MWRKGGEGYDDSCRKQPLLDTTERCLRHGRSKRNEIHHTRYRSAGLTSCISVVEQSLGKSVEHFLNVSTSIIPSAAVDDHAIPRFITVFKNVMYVPPKRESLIRKKNAMMATNMIQYSICKSIIGILLQRLIVGTTEKIVQRKRERDNDSRAKKKQL